MQTRQQFYKSKQWEDFRKVIIAERTDEDGYVRCAICGKPILKKYDLIIHHKKELDDMNVNDAMIALNPSNVECVHFKCHNELHERFSAGHAATYKPVKKQVFIVYGAPCSGKSTWVNEVASKNDLVVDMDSIWQMISINDRYDKPDALRSVAFEMRDKLYDIIKYRNGKWHNAYIITSGALKGDRDRLKVRVGADEVIHIDTDQITCMNRVKERHEDEQQVKWLSYVIDWFEKYQPDEVV